jgi:hypothetical protein
MIRAAAALGTATLLAMIGLSASGCSTLPQRAWCSNLTELTGNDCSFDTFEQCMASVKGLGSGNCTQNPRYYARHRAG